MLPPRFAAMMGMEMSWFREGRLIVFELMTEEAAINFWEVGSSALSSALGAQLLTVIVILPFRRPAILFEYVFHPSTSPHGLEGSI